MLLYGGLAKGIMGLNGLGMLGRRQASVNTGASPGEVMEFLYLLLINRDDVTMLD